MTLRTISDVRSEIGRRRLSQRALAEELSRSEASVSHLFSWEEEVVLSPRGAAMFADALKRAEAKADGNKRAAGTTTPAAQAR
jgi:hypothetical protein